MKTLKLLALLILPLLGTAQIEGDGNSATLTQTLPAFNRIKLEANAQFVVVKSDRNAVVLSTDSNLLEQWNFEVENNILVVRRDGWTAPKTDPSIVIYGSDFTRVEQNSNGMLNVVNFEGPELVIQSLSGQCKLSGKVDELIINQEVSLVDATDMTCESARVKIWSFGKVKLGPTVSIKLHLDQSAEVDWIEEPSAIQGKYKKSQLPNASKKTAPVKWIRFTIKNNSMNRNNFFVVGPKEDGSRFSYGFPMMPLATRKENWTTGTKVYKVNRIGVRTLLITIDAQDEGETVNLFE